MAPTPVVAQNLEDETALIEAVKAGDVTAFEVLVERYDRQVLRIAKHITQHAEDAGDVAQETFLKVFQKLPQFGRTVRILDLAYPDRPQSGPDEVAEAPPK